MAYIQFIGETVDSKESIFLDIMLACYNISGLDNVSYHYQKEMSLHKTFIDSEIQEYINAITIDVDTYEQYSKYPDEENPCVILTAVENKRLVCLFSADKVKLGKLVFEFAMEYLRIRPDNFLLINQIDLYDFNRIKGLT